MATSSKHMRAGLRLRAREPIRALTWVLCALVVAYLITVAVEFSQIVASIYRDADAASAPVIGQLLGGAPAHRDVVLGQMLWVSTLLFELATRWLPLHREIWEAAPYAMALASAALLGWGSWKVYGRWAALITAAIVICASPHTLHLLLSLNDHSPTWFSLSLIAASLVFAVRPGARLKPLPAAVAIGLVGAIVGVNMASDTLLLVAGVIPAAIAVVVARIAYKERAIALAFWYVVAGIVVAGVCDALAHAWARHESIVSPAGVSHIGLASGEALANNFKLWWQSIIVLGNGDFFGQTLGFTSALQVLCAALALAAVAIAARVAWLDLKRTLGERHLDANGESGRRICWVAFWGSSGILLSIAFIVSSLPVDIESDRYLLGVVYAVAALLPLVAGVHRWRRIAVTGASAVFALSAVAQLAQRQVVAEANDQPSYLLADEVERIAQREHLTVGYAGYWDAAPVTWATHMRVKVFPVLGCSETLCPYYLHVITSWYAPRSGTPSFLLSDPTQPGSVSPPASLGKPSATHTLGSATMYVYPYDIASRFQ